MVGDGHRRAEPAEAPDATPPDDRRAGPGLGRRSARCPAAYRPAAFRTLADPAELADEVARTLAADGIVAWFAGRAEFGPRALGQRSLLAHPGRRENLDRLNDIKGRERFRPVAPLVLHDRAPEIFDGPLPSPFMLFVHDVAPAWRDRIPAVVHPVRPANRWVSVCTQRGNADDELMRALHGPRWRERA
jgi:predicted NodU family carbamoyl transferase